MSSDTLVRLIAGSLVLFVIGLLSFCVPVTAHPPAVASPLRGDPGFAPRVGHGD
jgi:hypothetical protein